MASSTVREVPVANGYKFVFGTFDFDSSYPTGGESLDLSSYFDTIYGVIFESQAGYTFQYDKTNKKVKAFRVASLDLQAKIKAFKKAGAAAGAHAVTGLAATDKLLAAIQFDAIKDATSNTQQYKDATILTSEFSVTGTSVANNTGGTAGSANDGLLFLFAKTVPEAALTEVAASTSLATVTGVGFYAWGTKS